MVELKYRTCHLCEALCGMVVTVEQGRITNIRGDKDDVLSRGHICPKGPAMRELHEDPDRLRHPVRRTASGWERISWEQALDETACRLGEIRSRDGDDAVATYLGNPTAHNAGAVLSTQLLFLALGSKNRFDANSQDANPRFYVAYQMFGEISSLLVPDVDRTAHFLVLGANPAASGGSVMSLGDVRGRMAGIRERGGRLVLIDPRRTEFATYADEHHMIRPGGDAALLLAMLHVLFREGFVDEQAVGRVARGISCLRAAAQPFSPERVAPAVGIDAVTIRRLATDFAKAKSAAAYGRVGICHGPFGPVASWLIDALNIVTGNFDRPGGAMFASPAADLTAISRILSVSGTGRFRSRVRGLPEIGGMLPAAAMAEEMETPGRGQIRALLTVAGNPVLSVPNGERLARALARLDFMASVDPYINETTRHAHIILPPCSAFERGHYDLMLHAVAVRNTTKWSEPILPRARDDREEWDILLDLAQRLERELPARLGIALLRRIGLERTLDILLRAGPYGDRFLPFHDGLNLDKLRRAVHGIDFGPLVPMRKRRVFTQGGMVELAPPPLVADVPRVEKWLQSAHNGSLVLIGRRHLRSNNSWMHNTHSLVKGPDRSGLFMHPDDARRLSLSDGAMVQVKSRTGSVSVRLVLTGDIRQGVVSLPHGFGHADAAATLRIAGTLPGANANAITDDELVEPLTGTAILSGVPVTVQSLVEPHETALP